MYAVVKSSSNLTFGAPAHALRLPVLRRSVIRLKTERLAEIGRTDTRRACKQRPQYGAKLCR